MFRSAITCRRVPTRARVYPIPGRNLLRMHISTVGRSLPVSAAIRAVETKRRRIPDGIKNSCLRKTTTLVATTAADFRTERMRTIVPTRTVSRPKDVTMMVTISHTLSLSPRRWHVCQKRMAS